MISKVRWPTPVLLLICDWIREVAVACSAFFHECGYTVYAWKKPSIIRKYPVFRAYTLYTIQHVCTYTVYGIHSVCTYSVYVHTCCMVCTMEYWLAYVSRKECKNTSFPSTIYYCHAGCDAMIIQTNHHHHEVSFPLLVHHSDGLDSGSLQCSLFKFWFRLKAHSIRRACFQQWGKEKVTSGCRVVAMSRYRTSLTVFFLHFLLGSLSHNFVQKWTAGIWSKGSISCWSRRFQVRCLVLGSQSTRKSSRTPVPWYQSMSRGIWYMWKEINGWSIEEQSDHPSVLVHCT